MSITQPVHHPQEQNAYGTCPRCGNALILRERRKDYQVFLGCGGYPSCRFSRPYAPKPQGTLFDVPAHEELSQLRTQLASLQEDYDVQGGRYDSLTEENQRLMREVATLQRTIQFLELVARSTPHAPQASTVHDMVPLATLERLLTKLAAEVHPDRWQGSPVAEEAVKRVLALRDKARKGRL